MIYFISFFFILLIVGISELHFNNGDNKYFIKDSLISKRGIVLIGSLVLTFIILSIIGGIRVDVGVDYTTYRNLQIPMTLAGNYTIVEPLSTVIILIGAKLGSYQYIFAIFHCLIIYFSLKAIFDNSENISFSIFLLFTTGFFNSSMNLIRQSVAIAIFLYALKYIFDKKFIKYTFWIIVAVMFHKTAIIYLPIYFLNKIKLSKKILVVLGISIVLLSLIIENLLNFITTYFDIYRNYWGAAERLTKNNSSGTYWILNIFVLFVMIILVEIYRYKYKEFINSKLAIYIYIQIIAISIMLFSVVTYVPNFDRLLVMFSYVQIISLPSFFKLKPHGTLKKLLLIGIVIIFIASYVQLIILQNIGGTFPYSSIFNR